MRKRKFFTLFFALAAMMMLMMPSPVQAGNKYLWTFENFQVQTMGNGVLRFTLPAWVYGKGSNSTEYLEDHCRPSSLPGAERQPERQEDHEVVLVVFGESRVRSGAFVTN